MSRPRSSSSPAHGSRRARWGLLLSAMVMGLALIGTGVAHVVQANEASQTVARARASDLALAVRRAAWAERDRLAEALADVAADFADQGLTYVGVFDGRGVVAASTGEARGVPRHLPAAAGPERLRIDDLGSRLRVEVPFSRPRRVMREGPRLWLAIEYDPELALAMRAGAEMQLVLSVAAATVLLLFVLFFWRAAGRAERAEAQLARDRRLAALGEMSAVLGHELRNPLAALKGHAQLVVERLDGEHRAKKSAERVVHEARRLEALTSQILDFAKTGALARELVDPGALLTTAAASLADPRVAVDTSAAPPAWSLDGTRIEQVLANLLTNAAQAAPPEVGRVQATCALDGGRLLFLVDDDGPGFPPGEEEGAFEPFKTTRVQGTGLGLAIARRIVEAHGGTIAAERGPLGGARVRVVIPAAPAS